MKNLFKILIIIIAGGVFLQGCLSVESKEYSIKLTGPTSGTAKIKYVNIISTKDNDRDVSMKDFAELITDYIEGPKLSDEFQNVRNLKKKVYEENGVLVGEVTFDFDSLSHVKLFKYDKDSPYMLLAKESFSNEEYLESNGEYGGDKMPVVFWKKNNTEFKWTTTVSKDLSNAVSLLPLYQNWAKSNKK